MTTLLDQHPNHTSVMLIWESQRTCKDVETLDPCPAHRKHFALLNPLPGVFHVFHEGGRLDIVRLVFWSQHHPPTTNITKKKALRKRWNPITLPKTRWHVCDLSTSYNWNFKRSLYFSLSHVTVDRSIYFWAIYHVNWFAEILACQNFMDAKLSISPVGWTRNCWSTVPGLSPMVISCD